MIFILNFLSWLILMVLLVCHDNFICPMCAKIDICLNGHTSVLIDCYVGADDVVSSELMDPYTKVAAKSSTLFDDLCIEFPELVVVFALMI